MGCKTSKVYPGSISYVKHPNPQLRDKVFIPVHESQNKLYERLKYNQKTCLKNIKFAKIC